MKRLAFAFAFAFVVRCVPLERVHITIPDAARNASLVLLIYEPEPRGARAVAAERDGALEVLAQPGAVLRLLAYSGSLAARGLAPGPFEASRCRADCARLTPRRVFEATWTGDEIEWTPAELSDADAELLIEDQYAVCGQCAPYEQTTLDVAAMAFVDERGDDAVGVTVDGDLVRIRADEAPVVECALGARVSAGGSDGTAVIVGYEDGRVVDVTPTCRETLLGRVPAKPIRIAPDGPGSAYVMTSSAAFVELWRVDPGDVERIFVHELHPAIVMEPRWGYWGEIVRLGPDHVLFVIGDHDIHEIEDGTLTSRMVQGQRAYNAQSLAVVEGQRFLALAPWGLARWIDGEWRLVTETAKWGDFGQLVVAGDRMLMATSGDLGFYDIATGRLCPSFSVEPNRAIVRAARIAGDSFVLAEQPLEGDAAVRILRPAGDQCE